MLYHMSSTETEYQVRLAGTGSVLSQHADDDAAEQAMWDAQDSGWRAYVVWVEQDANGEWFAQED
jgi:hypothetical protein